MADIIFEEILPYIEGEGDTGKTSREKINRNFDKLKGFDDALGDIADLKTAIKKVYFDINHFNDGESMTLTSLDASGGGKAWWTAVNADINAGWYKIEEDDGIAPASIMLTSEKNISSIIRNIDDIVSEGDDYLIEVTEDDVTNGVAYIRILYSDANAVPTLTKLVRIDVIQEIDSIQDSIGEIKEDVNELFFDKLNLKDDSAIQLSDYNSGTFWTTNALTSAGWYKASDGDGTIDSIKLSTLKGTSGIFREIDLTTAYHINNFYYFEITGGDFAGEQSVYVRLHFTNASVSPTLTSQKSEDNSALLESLSNEIDELKESTISDGNLMPMTDRLDGDTIIGETSSSGYWYPFHISADNIEILDGCVKVEAPSDSQAYKGIRKKRPSFLIDGETYVIQFQYKADHAFNFYAYPVTSLTPAIASFEAANDWTDASIEGTVDETWDRLQFGFSGTSYGTMYLKDFSITIKGEGSLNVRISNVEKLLGNPLEGKNISVLGDSISSSSRNNAPYYKIVENDVNNEIESYITHWDVYSDENGQNPTNKSIGGVPLSASMIGMKQTLTPISEDIGKELGIGWPHNQNGVLTWSELLCASVGANWLSDAAWSGSRMTTGQTDSKYALSEGCGDCAIGRLRKRNDDGSYTNPDVVLIYYGTNDMTHPPYAHIDDVNLMNGIPNTDVDGNGYNQFKAAYCICIQKIRNAYPNSFIVCCTLNVFKRVNYSHFPTHNGIYTLPQMNDAIRDVANMMGCGLIEFDKDGITFENCYPTYISDSETRPTHPNQNGHKVMAKKAEKDLLKYFCE